jgi:hypothetical protein
MPPPEPLDARTHREGLRVVWILLFSALTLVPATTWAQVREPSTAEEVVTAFMEALRDKDLERAYRFIDGDVPSGEAAAFLHPDALGEWELLAVEQPESDSMLDEPPVSVTIGTEEGTAEGSFTVYEEDGEYTLTDPFQTVTLAASSYLSVQVNDRTVPMPLETTWQAWYQGQAQRTIDLLPGVYRFFGGEPVALLGDREGNPPVIGAPLPEPGEEAAASLQRAVNDYIDGCVEYRQTARPGCPFASDGLVDTDDRRRLDEIRDPLWTVKEYPVVTVVPGTGMYDEPVLLVEFTEPGRLALQGTGTQDWETWEPFTAACRFGAGALHVLAEPDGSIRVAPLGQSPTDTCRGTA